MLRALAKFTGTLLFALTAVGIVFVAGMRAKSPPVLNTVRRISRATKPMVLKTAGQAGTSTSVIRHVGRSSGQEYETPVSALTTDGGFLIALPYGRNTDWLKNVLASGSATVVDQGTTYTVDQPEIVPLSEAEPDLPPDTLRPLHLFRVEECLRIRRAPEAAAQPTG
ncbi:MAG TPA: nitroreductase family deazaflavin-dependent oxidoreductase [Acidimicrobiales bacterium]|nr:nitroreductase family deazaflavin-dependent oxidoreductase [Acidimicrobiales bacterium]